MIEQTARLLWEACRRKPNPVAIEKAIACGADVALASSAAEEHRIGPLLWRTLAAADSLGALGPARRTLQGVASANKMEALLLLPRSVALAVRPLTDAGLEPVILKGPVIADRYPEPGLRPMDDIDILLPPADHAAALSVLVRNGWNIARAGRRDLYDSVLTHPDVPTFSLELHYGLESPSQRVTTLDANTLWRTRLPIDCMGTPAFGLPAAEELVVLAAHAGKPHHGFARMIWIADLAMLIGVETHDKPTMDWERVAAIARENRCLTVTAAALALARRVGVDSPGTLFPLPEHGVRGETFRRLLRVTWPLDHLDLPGYRLNYALTDSPLQRIKILIVLRASGHRIGTRVRALLSRDDPRYPVGVEGGSRTR